jgi:cell division protein DivIC
MENTFDTTNLSKPFLKRGLDRLPYWIKNKYFIAGMAFVVWMLFFDRNDLFSQFERLSHSKELSKNEAHQTLLITETHKELDLLKNSAQTIEKYAREKYMMKKDNEDLFIIAAPAESK